MDAARETERSSLSTAATNLQALSIPRVVVEYHFMDWFVFDLDEGLRFHLKIFTTTHARLKVPARPDGVIELLCLQ
jgi:hypothetical protein